MDFSKLFTLFHSMHAVPFPSLSTFSSHSRNQVPGYHDAFPTPPTIARLQITWDTISYHPKLLLNCFSRNELLFHAPLLGIAKVLEAIDLVINFSGNQTCNSNMAKDDCLRRQSVRKTQELQNGCST